MKEKESSKIKPASLRWKIVFLWYIAHGEQAA